MRNGEYRINMNMLVGYTGFVGSNLYVEGQFDYVYNSKNIKEAYGKTPDLLIYAGLRAEKYLANANPERDMELIQEAESNINQINPRKLVLISTIDVLKNPQNVDEFTEVDVTNLQAYGYNRYQLEVWVREHYPDALIIRLPALFGRNIKKNFIYDYINQIPFMLKKETFDELVQKEIRLKKYYQLQNNGFYKVNVNDCDRGMLRKLFAKVGFSALNFTDSRSIYQFYNLSRLWRDIQIAINNKILLWHPAVEPVSAGELYEYLTGKKFENILSEKPVYYNYNTAYDSVFSGKNGYICTKKEILEEIRSFVDSFMVE